MVMAADEGNIVSRRDPQIRRAPNAAGLYDVLDLILDKGLVIDAFVRVSLVGIELLTVDLRVVIASVDTYLRYAEGAERLQLYNRSGAKRLGDIATETKKGTALEKGAETVGKALTGNGRHAQAEDQQEEGEGEEQEEGITGTLAKGVRNVVGKIVHTVTGSEEDDDQGDNPKQEQRPQPGGGQQRQPERQRSSGNGGGAGRPKAGARR